MAEIITTADVKDFCPDASILSDAVIQRYIDTVDQADTCLDSNGAIAAAQQLLKLSAICHFITRKGGGQVKSERDFEGASVTFAAYQSDGYGLESTTFGQDIASSQYRSCFSFMDQKTNRFVVAGNPVRASS
jgi:hypothetical protein